MPTLNFDSRASPINTAIRKGCTPSISLMSANRNNCLEAMLWYVIFSTMHSFQRKCALGVKTYCLFGYQFEWVEVALLTGFSCMSCASKDTHCYSCYILLQQQHCAVKSTNVGPHHDIEECSHSLEACQDVCKGTNIGTSTCWGWTSDNTIKTPPRYSGLLSDKAQKQVVFWLVLSVASIQKIMENFWKILYENEQPIAQKWYIF